MRQSLPLLDAAGRQSRQFLQTRFFTRRPAEHERHLPCQRGDPLVLMSVMQRSAWMPMLGGALIARLLACRAAKVLRLAAGSEGPRQVLSPTWALPTG